VRSPAAHVSQHHIAIPLNPGVNSVQQPWKAGF
jgi:hypothetical protein